MTSVLLSCLLVSVASQRVTLDQAGTTEAIVKTVAEQTGRKLSVAPDLRRHMMYLHVMDAPTEEVLTHCASALRATWTSTGSETTLDRTAAQSQALLREERAEVSRQIADYFARERELTVRTADPRATAAAFVKRLLREEKAGAPKFVGPPEGLLADLLRGVGVEKLAEIPPYEIALFSNRPTSAEGSLPASAGEAIERFGQVQDAIVALMPEDVAREKFGAYTAMRIFNAERGQTAIGRVLVSAYRTDDRFFANLAVYDAEGSIRAEAALSIPFTSSLPEEGHEATATPIELSADREALARALVATEAAELDAETRRTLRAPDRFDPLEIQVVPAFRALMKERGGNGAFALPDRLVKATLEGRPRTAADFTRVMHRLGMGTKSEAGWTESTLPASLQSSRHYLDREAFGRWMRAMTASNGDPLRATALLYARCETAISASDLSRGYGAQVLEALGEPPPRIEIPRWLIFVLGTLNDREWTALMAGQPVPVATTPKRAYWATEWSRSSFRVLERRAQLMPVADALRTGSAAFPTEVPRDASLRLERGGKWTVWGAADAAGGTDIESLSEWAASQASSSGDEEIAKVLPGKYHLASQEFLTFRLAWDDRLQTTARQDTGVQRVNGAALAFREWPLEAREGFRRSFARNVAERAKTQAPPP